MSENRFLSKLSSPNVLVFLLVVLALSAVFFGWKGWRSSFKYALISNGINNTTDLNKTENILTNQKENETLDSALRRFKRSCAKAGIQQEIRKREHYEKPSVRRKKKSEAARKRKYN